MFMTLLVAMISGFLVADKGCTDAYNRSFTSQKVEDGHVSFQSALTKDQIKRIEKKADIALVDLRYFEEEWKSSNIRVYENQNQMNVASVLEGKLPTKRNEIALDRMFAQNNDIQVGDTITLKSKKLHVVGLIALPNYSSLFESNSDMMFDSLHFSVALMSSEGFTQIKSNHMVYNYGWFYDSKVDHTNKEVSKEASDKVMETLMEEGLVMREYVPRYLNQAITFVGEDLSGDKAMFVVFDYILTLVIAFVFAITMNNTIQSQSRTIGTLRASGYSKGQLIAHYMIVPMIVGSVASLIGTILGYTLFNDYFVELYYGSYSLGVFEASWNAEAFLLTTCVPLIILFVVNFIMFRRIFRFSVLSFLRQDLYRKNNRRAFHLSSRLSFLTRFRLRILFQNIPSYFTLFVGIFIGGVLMIFSLMFIPMLDAYRDVIIEDRICDYQYVLKQEVDINNDQAERYKMTSLVTTDTAYLEDEINIYAIEEESAYVKGVDGVEISSSVANKYNLVKGDYITLKDPYYHKKKVKLKIDGVTDYMTGMAIFMDMDTFEDQIDAQSVVGYFSNEKLSELDDVYVSKIITKKDLTKVSDQLTVSFRNMVGIFVGIGGVIFVLLMFLLSKQIIERNQQSIAMTKILGFTTKEIARLYIVATGIVVMVSLIVIVPLIDIALRWVFESYLYHMITGYFPYMIDPMCYIKMIGIGIACYLVIVWVQYMKLGRIHLSEAIKEAD